MKNTKHLLAGLGMLPLLAILSISPAAAQTNVGKAILEKLTTQITKLENSCADDIKKFCSTVTPGEGRLLYCMHAYEDQISPKCAFDVEETATSVQLSMDSLKDAVAACKAEITGVCGSTQPGQGRIAACLIANKSTASKGCVEALDKVEGMVAH
jgi:hypothetical protein